ncbi:MAG: thermonuclease family protein [Candidatus Hodarchaeaceae archaeon]|nr:thermonuclease family protein [Candidatus Hodarchaeaceae archaeon]
MSRGLALAFLALVFALALVAVKYPQLPWGSREPNIEKLGVVASVLDGDTIVIGSGERVRLVGINAPELHPEPQPGALEAKRFVENLCPPGTEVGLDIDDMRPRDKYGRTLAVVYVRVDGSWVNLNAELLRNGHAEVLYFSPSEFNPYRWLKN